VETEIMICNSDLISFTASVAFILIYYLYLKLKHNPEQSNVHTFNAQIRKQWVYKIMGNDSLSIVAIQTLRNSVIAANFMASTSILLIMGALNLGDKTKQLQLLLPFNDIISVSSADTWQFKLGLLLLNFAFAFYCFSMATRFFNHVGYMISLPVDNNLIKQTSAYLNKAGSYYSLGIRTFFFSIPIILWFFNPYFLMLGTLILIAWLAALNKVPL
jgi:uncharacterized membrane protein